MLAKARQLGYDLIGLQETRKSGETEFSAAGYRVFCSGQEETEGRQGLYGVGLAVKESICRKSVYTHQLIDYGGNPGYAELESGRTRLPPS